jgi:hypothetical protein
MNSITSGITSGISTVFCSKNQAFVILADLINKKFKEKWTHCNVEQTSCAKNFFC